MEWDFVPNDIREAGEILFNELLFSLKEMGEVSRLAADTYTLKEGLYICLNGGSHQELLIEKKSEYTGELYETIRARDFYSSIINTNKAIDDKKQIHSNNIYSLFFKYSNPKEIKNGQINILDVSETEQHINRYFDNLLNWYAKNKKVLENAGVEPIDNDKIQRQKEYLVSKINLIQQLIEASKLKFGKYVRIFCEATEEEYIHASNLYLLPKVFNKSDYDIEVNGKIFGLSNFNMGTNSKKPYLEHKTTTYGVPFRISLQEALDGYRLQTWLNSQKDEGKSIDAGYLPYFNNSSFSLLPKINKNEGAQYLHFSREISGPEIDDYESLPQSRTELDKPIKIRNFLQLPEFKAELIKELSDLENIVDEYFFNGNLLRAYYNDPSVKSGFFTARQATLLQLSKGALISLFKKFDKSSFISIFDKLTLELVIEQLKLANTQQLEYTRFAKALNIRFNLLEYYQIGGKEKMGSLVNDIYDSLKEKVLRSEPKEPLVCESDEEFYFAAGQLARYLLSLSRAQKASYSLINPILNAKDGSKIKFELVQLIKKYGHDIEAWSTANRSHFDNLQSVVNGYACKGTSIMADMLLAGFAAPNIIYFKKEN